MDRELVAAADWLLQLIIDRCYYVYDPTERMKLEKPVQPLVSINRLSIFHHELIQLLKDKYKDNWFENDPACGQSYRAIHISPQSPTGLDNILLIAAERAELDYKLLNIDSMTFTIWIDPRKVSVRFDDKDPIFILKQFRRR